ncbi:Golgi to ER traffic protein 4 homolog isoform X2 [Phoenix dactylifera]|uniref:Golgi to ER traffic protein 4 homolog isoform X2 n=1 Tax=Phoenix dactylifera TaxID=42345 RepID=A0A8B8J4N8_PHODC|nr:Golgi to ER traffic protein 4 homolog isoform X2 [Phoenix dactylifera]
MSRSRVRRGELPPPQETIEKLEKMVEDGNYYPAQQIYKSSSARYIAVQKYSEALDILQAGALIQLKHGQKSVKWQLDPLIYCVPLISRTLISRLVMALELNLIPVSNCKVTCGAELAVLFVETLAKGKLPYSEETLDHLRKIYQGFPKIPLPQNSGDDDDDDMQKLSEALMAAKLRVESCSSFLKAAIRWSAEFGAPKNGSPQLHDMLAEYLYSESPEPDMTKVSSHFVHGSDPKKFASTLVNFMGTCYPGEDDAAIARAVLLYLSQGNLRDANYLMDELKKQLESKQLDFPCSDLTQFIEYLLRTLERDAFPLLKILRQKYKSSIDREPLFDEMKLQRSFMECGAEVAYKAYLAIFSR